ncbi:MAG: Rha family transcriptional regulator [Alphaproteobacteria bacterium]|nr:Rha family transcriptional regulator [Alphaproteobacteria bacterium]
MSSREIAELTGKRHDHVMADIRKMLKSLGLHSPEFSGQYRDATGRYLPCFNLPKRETLILVSGYSVELRARIIDRWQELEARQAPAIPTTFAEALRLAADLAEQKAAAWAGLVALRVKPYMFYRLFLFINSFSFRCSSSDKVKPCSPSTSSPASRSSSINRTCLRVNMPVGRLPICNASNFISSRT